MVKQMLAPGRACSAQLDISGGVVGDTVVRPPAYPVTVLISLTQGTALTLRQPQWMGGSHLLGLELWVCPECTSLCFSQHQRFHYPQSIL